MGFICLTSFGSLCWHWITLCQASINSVFSVILGTNHVLVLQRNDYVKCKSKNSFFLTFSSRTFWGNFSSRIEFPTCQMQKDSTQAPQINIMPWKEVHQQLGKTSFLMLWFMKSNASSVCSWGTKKTIRICTKEYLHSIFMSRNDSSREVMHFWDI